MKGFVDELLANGATWTDRYGETHDIGLVEILTVAAYNAQVDAKGGAGEDARVGTVDKF